ncbi:transmembrane ascorbate-dependent reductase CYB561-like isoform X2 [Haliotis rubra]|uniref:transmembrane ascorbate-dependent reductase CYB561-like isoform X1 n=2 Tax=Haliotis rubra TaxID=36100 RepID=UPI001EE55450|nr:transmembrane ascorbate-dependent reductase CYB561-like isoform X1 [Haliotis rubra]XP_046573342.1 transmembrane ascorbate-dependent reductase CYB561-like isoform X2 [Haliotis rubra]XP_046573350.1 transmembrane ascorbate-dependent reductase CYB561-like isoform X2 [Haliotis rubra]XP_046573357.1 transmembrane ascorbate-dependent reductase CYB561-like isoform X2 [Haliotis rubra]
MAENDTTYYEKDEPPRVLQSQDMENFDGGSSSATSFSMKTFTWLVLLVQVFGLAAVVMVAVWMGHFRGGFAWQSNPGLEFNYHPLFMIIGMVFLFGDAILAYRVFRNDNKLIIKIVHACMQAGALIFAAVGLKAVFDSHNLPADPIPNLYSLHSWLGIITVVMFGLQWVFGFVSYLYPKVGMASRRMYMPYHVFWGIAILCFAVATALMGITEKVIFSKISYSSFIPEGVLLNCLGLTIVAFVTLVVFLVTRPEFKRPPGPEEEHLQLAE